jgi:hypothetical protein
MGISNNEHDDFEDQWEEDAIEEAKWRLALSTTLRTAKSIRALPTRTPRARLCLEQSTLRPASF